MAAPIIRQNLIPELQAIMKRFFLPKLTRQIGDKLSPDLPSWARMGENEIWPQPVANHRLIIDKITDPTARIYYLRATASRSLLGS